MGHLLEKFIDLTPEHVQFSALTNPLSNPMMTLVSHMYSK